jgi:hypothetical protein
MDFMSINIFSFNLTQDEMSDQKKVFRQNPDGVGRQ